MIILCVTVSVSGCSVVMAARQPEKKDLDVVRQGATLAQVRSEFGEPVLREEKDGTITEVYNFKQGYHTGTKAARSLFHGAADLFTLGIWEVVGTPTEAVFHGRDMSVQVDYKEGAVVSSQILKR